MVEKRATVQNAQGIHARPSTVIYNTVRPLNTTVEIEADNGSCQLNSVLALLGLGLMPGDTVTLKVDGEDEEKVCDQLCELFERHFDFPPKEGKTT